MISVANFYWTLFENLLGPAGLDCYYYYPWGTKHNLSQSEFKQFRGKSDLHHVFFHFDQEPLWSDQLGLYDSVPTTWSNTWAKILANSEHSQVKNQICKQRGFLDWYFFYHGFAALDWYRDAEYISHNYPINDVFLSFNHTLDRRSYRLALLARMLDRHIAHRGSISLHVTLTDVKAELSNPNTDLSQISLTLVDRHIKNLLDLPWRLDDVPINGDLSARFGYHEYRLWQNSLWHVVNETVFYETKLHLTEKVFKPIVAQRPFILVSAPGNLAYLRRYGFQTFDRWIDESYDDIQDPDQRLDAITSVLERFADMSIDQLRQLHNEMLPVLEHNKQHFFGRFREVIVSELLENFERCIRIWNNGRVDGRELRLPENTAAFRSALLK